MNKKNKNAHIENNKNYCPYLLAASFSKFINFNGSLIKENTLYWKFSPEKKAIDLISLFQTRTEPHIPARDLFEAIEIFWKQVDQMKKGETLYGK